MSEGTLSGTIAEGEKFGAAVMDLFAETAAVIGKAPIDDTLKADAMEEVAEVVTPTATPTPTPTPEPEMRWETPAEHTPSAGDVYSRVDRVAINSAGKEVPIISMWKYMYPDEGGYRMYDAANSKVEIVVPAAEMKSNYKLLEIAPWFSESMGGRRKTRRGRGKKRRTVKRRAKSLRRRRQ